MIDLSTQAKLRLQDNQRVLFKADFTLSKAYGRNQGVPSEIMTLHGDDVMSGSATITDATTSSGSFDIGSAIIGSFDITLNNFDDRFSLYDFTDATMRIYLGVPLVDDITDEDDADQVEWFTKGFYTVDKPTSIGNTIPLTMLDNMSKFEVLFKYVGNITQNSNLATYLTEICKTCGVVIATTVPHPEWTISERPTDENITCLDMIGYIAQINGCYAHINRMGELTFSWYDSSQFDVDSSSGLDGGTFLTKTTPYSDGDNAEGGEFDFSSEDYIDEEGIHRVKYANPTENYDGGTFAWGDYAVIQAFQSYSVGTDVIKITGIEYIIENLDETAEEDTNTYLYDKYGIISDAETTRKNNAMEYCLSVSENKLLSLLNEKEACLFYVANKICGLYFTPFNISTLPNPQYEVGDPVRILSNKGDNYDSFITSLSYPLNGYEILNCDAETTNQRNSVQNNPLSTAIANVKNDTNKKLSKYDEAVHRLSMLSANALGFYSTTEVQIDGSKIEYMHDAPTLNGSLHAYKMTATGFFIGNRPNLETPWETEGVWISGVDMSGNAVYRTLIAGGIDADVINVTNLEVGENVIMGDKAYIGWSKVGTATDGKPAGDFITGGTSGNMGTYITQDYIETLNIKAGSVDAENINAGTIKACQFGNGSVEKDSRTKIDIKSETGTRLVFGGPLEGGYSFGCNIITGDDIEHTRMHDGFGTLWSGDQAVGTFLHYDNVRKFTDGGAHFYEVQWGGMQVSDVRLKKDIKDLDKNVIRRFFNKLRPVSFRYKDEDDKEENYGFIAQEIEEIVKECDFEKNKFLTKDVNGYYELLYSTIDRLSSMAVHDLYEIVDNQQQQIDYLKEEIERLKQKIQ